MKTLAKQLPLYGRQAVGSALTALSVAGHLRRVRRLVGEGEQVRWVFRTFWSRTARDNEWWADYLAAEDNRAGAAAEPEPSAAASRSGWVPTEFPFRRLSPLPTSRFRPPCRSRRPSPKRGPSPSCLPRSRS
ncbi:hypothetical protein GCM10018966_083790 [Streptomyces yanii]